MATNGAPQRESWLQGLASGGTTAAPVAHHPMHVGALNRLAADLGNIYALDLDADSGIQALHQIFTLRTIVQIFEGLDVALDDCVLELQHDECSNAPAYFWP